MMTSGRSAHGSWILPFLVLHIQVYRDLLSLSVGKACRWTDGLNGPLSPPGKPLVFILFTRRLRMEFRYDEVSWSNTDGDGGDWGYIWIGRIDFVIRGR